MKNEEIAHVKAIINFFLPLNAYILLSSFFIFLFSSYLCTRKMTYYYNSIFYD